MCNYGGRCLLIVVVVAGIVLVVAVILRMNASPKAKSHRATPRTRVARQPVGIAWRGVVWYGDTVVWCGVV
jgi:hypothetical protein